MNEEIKKDQSSSVRSFRVTDDVMARFNAVKDDLKLNQDAALAMLINAYEMERAKEVLPDRETEIANFQMKAKELVDAFLFSLQLNADAEDRVRSEVALKMERLEKTIAEYQAKLEQEREKVSSLEAEKTGLEASISELEQLRFELSRAMQEQEEIKVHHDKQMKDKEDIISMLQDKLAVAEQEPAGYDVLKAEKDVLEVDLKAAQDEKKEMKHNFEMQTFTAARNAEKALETAVTAVKADADAKIADLKEQLHQTELDAERRLRAAENASAAEILKLEQEISSLRETIATLKAKNTLNNQE